MINKDGGSPWGVLLFLDQKRDRISRLFFTLCKCQAGMECKQLKQRYVVQYFDVEERGDWSFCSLSWSMTVAKNGTAAFGMFASWQCKNDVLVIHENAKDNRAENNSKKGNRPWK